MDFGLSFAQNVSSAIPRFAHVSSKSSPEFKHSQLQRSRNDVPQLSDASLVSAFAAKLLKKGTNNKSLSFCLEAWRNWQKTCQTSYNFVSHKQVLIKRFTLLSIDGTSVDSTYFD